MAATYCFSPWRCKSSAFLWHPACGSSWPMESGRGDAMPAPDWPLRDLAASVFSQGKTNCHLRTLTTQDHLAVRKPQPPIWRGMKQNGSARPVSEAFLDLVAQPCPSWIWYSEGPLPSPCSRRTPSPATAGAQSSHRIMRNNRFLLFQATTFGSGLLHSNN